jgi:hypothetical protein
MSLAYSEPRYTASPDDEAVRQLLDDLRALPPRLIQHFVESLRLTARKYGNPDYRQALAQANTETPSDDGLDVENS